MEFDHGNGNMKLEAKRENWTLVKVTMAPASSKIKLDKILKVPISYIESIYINK